MTEDAQALSRERWPLGIVKSTAAYVGDDELRTRSASISYRRAEALSHDFGAQLGVLTELALSVR
ncbi:hypothetical protein A6A40_23335 (plasmid) [Azospirillum humicireducens]|uniref:Uncharacterized protein n=1 Tax=Azospirillum humicireducens TaxID=1226968 RepID=A0A2R4VU57_9PROT|nr:hypothetical protein A6A40_23335 [Azospirillum humicireducens]